MPARRPQSVVYTHRQTTSGQHTSPPVPCCPPVSRAAGRARTWATVERSLHESQQLRGAAARRLAANAGSVVLTAEAEDRLVNKVSITTLLITTLAITHHYSSEGGILRARAAAV